MLAPITMGIMDKNKTTLLKFDVACKYAYNDPTAIREMRERMPLHASPTTTE